jgi:hypothetical protein
MLVHTDPAGVDEAGERAETWLVNMLSMDGKVLELGGSDGSIVSVNDKAD